MLIRFKHSKVWFKPFILRSSKCTDLIVIHGHGHLRPAHKSIRTLRTLLYLPPLNIYIFIAYIKVFTELHRISFLTKANVCRSNSCSAKVPNVRLQGNASSKHWLTGVGWQMSVRWIESHDQTPGWILGKHASFLNGYTTERLWRTSQK